MAKYNVIPAKDVADDAISATDRVLIDLYAAVKGRVMPFTTVAPKDIPDDFVDELKSAGYKVEIEDWTKDANQWRVFWDFSVYRTVEKEQIDKCLDV